MAYPAGQNFLNPSSYQHSIQQAAASIPSQRPTSTPNNQPLVSSSGRTRAASKRALYNAENAADEADQHEIQRFENPLEMNPGDRGDTEYAGSATKARKKGAGKNTKSTRAAAQSIPASSTSHSQLTAVTNPPALVPPPLPTNPSSNSQLYLPPYPNSATTTFFTTPTTIPPYPPSQGYPALVTTAPMPGDTARSSVVPTSSAVPMGIWSHSASPHGGSLDGAFLATAPFPTSTMTSPAVQAPLASHSSRMDSGFVSEEDEDDEDILSPFSPTVQPGAPQPTSGLPVPPGAHVYDTGSSPYPGSNANESRQSSEGPEEDDVLEALRTKTKRRRLPHTRIAPTNSDSSSTQASLEKIDADPTNLYAYSDQERPVLHLARVIYGAMLVTKEAMPNPATARAFQIEAYLKAGTILNTGIPSTLPPSPSSTILRLIAKHASASRGRLKAAALNVVVYDYGIKGDGRADSAAIAGRVAHLLDRKNFTYREVSAQGRAGIFRNPAIANVLLSTLFRDRESEGVLAKHLFLPLIPEGAIFMACTALEHALDMWSTGVKVSKDFSNDPTRRQIWTRHKNTWYDYIERKGEVGEKYARETREMITSQIRAVLDGLNPTSSQSAAISDAESFFDDNDAD